MKTFLQKNDILVCCDNMGKDTLILNRAIEKNDIELVLKMIAQKVDINDDYEGITPLLVSCARKRTAIFQILLAAGADVTKKSKKGITAMHLLLSEFIAQKLLEHGSDVNATDNKGPLHHCIQ